MGSRRDSASLLLPTRILGGPGGEPPPALDPGSPLEVCPLASAPQPWGYTQGLHTLPYPHDTSKPLSRALVEGGGGDSFLWSFAL